MFQTNTKTNEGTSSDVVYQVETRKNNVPQERAIFTTSMKPIHVETGARDEPRVEVVSSMTLGSILDRVDIKQMIEGIVDQALANSNVAGFATLSGAAFVDIPPSWKSKLPELLKHTYAVDMRQCFSILDRDEDSAFYFYPGEMKGFIESCILASQRVDPIQIRDIEIFKDLTAARVMFGSKAEVHMAMQSRFDYNGMSASEYEIDLAMRLAVQIDDIVQRQMSLLRELHGDYAIDQRSLYWTAGNAVLLTILY